MALIGTLTSGVSALNSFAKGLEVIGNNITNVNTTGFKGSRANYQDGFSNLLQGSAPSQGATGSNTSSKQIGTGVSVQSVRQDFAQGSIQSTGTRTDLAVSGSGFFRVRDSVGAVDYATRAGDFRIDDNDFLVTTGGFRVQGLNDGAAGPPAVAPTTVGDLKIDNGGSALAMQSYTIDQQGNINVFLSDGSTFVRGKVLLQNYKDTSALMQEGHNLYSGLAAASPIGGIALTAANNGPGTNGLGNIQSGALELANVDLTQEFANLITTQRSFQAASRLITTSDSVLEEIVNLKR